MAEKHQAFTMLNPTDHVMFDTYGGLPLIFPPDPEKRPGTYKLARVSIEEADKDPDELHEEISEEVEDWRSLASTTVTKVCRISDEPSSNVVKVPPGWYEAHFQSPGERHNRGLAGLEVLETSIEELARDHAELKKQVSEARELVSNRDDINDLLASLQAAAEEVNSPEMLALAERAAGLRTKLTAQPDPAKPLNVPSTKKGKGRK